MLVTHFTMSKRGVYTSLTLTNQRVNHLKHTYRRQVVLKFINSDIGKCRIDLLDASRMLHKAWKLVTAQTIANCFRKAGFNNREVDTEIVTEEPVEPFSERWQEIAPDVSYDTYVNIDDGVAVCGELKEEEILQEVTKNHISPDDLNAVIQEPVPSSSEALKMVEGLRSFIEAEPNVNDDLFQSINQIEDFIYHANLKKNKQTKITHIFM